MAVKIQTTQGAIEIENDVIATIVGGAATDNYGVVGMASQNPLRDGVNQILNGHTNNTIVVSSCAPNDCRNDLVFDFNCTLRCLNLNCHLV